MKPITFESIRNLLRTKKKSKDKGVDASFKRSDSFKRISIRKSYLDRGRKRGLRPKTIIDFDDVELKNGALINLSVKEDETTPKRLDKEKTSLQKINELLFNDSNEADNDDEQQQQITSSPYKSKEIEVQTVAIEFQNYNSSESIYNDLIEADINSNRNNQSKISQISINLCSPSTDYIQINDNYKEIEKEEEKSMYSINTFMLDNFSTYSDPYVEQNKELPSLVTFKTFCEPLTLPQTYLETNFDYFEPSTIQSNVSFTSLNYEKPIDTNTFTKSTKNKNSEGVVIHIPAITDHKPTEKENLKKQLSNDSALDVEFEKAIIEPISRELDHSISYFEEQEFYDNADIVSPDTSIPYLLKQQEPHQKALYSVNLGRIWKQLHLGPNDGQTLEQPTKNDKTIISKKNESFKSMSSRDSGFSLTLTKPKHLFRQKSKKSYNRKNRDGYFKRIMVVQRNSSRRKKKPKQNDSVFKNWKNTRRLYDQEDTEEILMREFEAFCSTRNKLELSNHERNYHTENDTFNQEIFDLEKFYEEHLRQLKRYYLQKKKINEAAIRDFYEEDCIENNLNLFDYTFPYPDKRTGTNKKKNQHKFQEIRNFSTKSSKDLKYASLLFTETESSLETSEQLHESIPYAEIQFPSKDFLEFPYCQLARKLTSTKRTRKSVPRSRFLDDEIFDDDFYNQGEISLASIFPSINDINTCNTCSKSKKKEIKEEDDGSDEFSEHEFLANSIGEYEICKNCKNTLSYCCCNNDSKNWTDSKSYCDCNSIKQLFNRRKVKRKKSRRRVRKNHSTLRRGYSYYSKSLLCFIFFINLFSLFKFNFNWSFSS